MRDLKKEHGELRATADLIDELDEETRALEASVLDGVIGAGCQDVGSLEERRDLERRRAALVVRRAANQHACPGRECAHPDHRRDVHFTATLIEMLGLPGEYPVITLVERESHGRAVAAALPRHGGKRPTETRSNSMEWGHLPIEKRRY